MKKISKPSYENRDDEIINTLRKILSDLETGKTIRVALDLQALIQDLENKPCQESQGE